jgi:shikimate dehydrogenase
MEIIPFLDRLDTSAELYGAVNCVKFNERSSEYIGYNTDGYGFLKSIDALDATLDSKILLLGCGGAGRMMAFEAIKAGADLTVAIRRTREEEKAAAKLSGEIREITGEFFAKTSQLSLNGPAKMRIVYVDNLNMTNSYNLLINATPCGMYPNENDIPISPNILEKVEFLFDAIYNPSPTKLIVEAEKRGVKTLGGMMMLVYQAAMAETIWHSDEGLKISDNITRAIIRECEEKLQQ